jgi:RNA polymerase sigma-70 factor, ECF subfamily
MSLTDLAAGFFDRHHVRVFRYLRRAVGSTDVAEDLSQEVFLRVVRGLPSYEHRQQETAWVFRIVRNVLADHWRRPGAPDAADVDDDDGPSAPATQLARASLDEALRQLSPLNREILLLREAVGLTYDEIALAVGLTLPAVRSRLARTREWLQATVLFERDADRRGSMKGGSREG